MSDYISRADAKEAVYLLGKRPQISDVWDCLDALPSADVIPIVDLTDGKTKLKAEDWVYDATPSADAEQVTGKLKNPCDSLLTEDSAECKEQKSKLEHDRDWIIGCIEHDGFIHTHRFDKANQIIHDALSAEATKKKAELKENGDWDCPDVGCDECDHHRSVEWCSLAIPNHEEKIDETYKMVNEAFFEGFDAAEKRYRFLIEYVEELDKKLAETEWIPCSERLPDNKTYVLTTIQVSGRQPHARSGFYQDGFFHNYNGDTWRATDKEVIAWMPLPKPYIKDGEA